ncbi:uncharacterized protein K452DRAFT_74433 [Aplosporella prunicola CBS 121167]|uniref:Uncharacterized protein n=1 Tax=Aplosporella prunicola CBS 121167 TaxID=1176127 RepID=A0A6A6B7S6_9PEZI|nr:uncharacterized protein K452DRAFT_74433 [Aplosporella prunicola CBS 121167]KAF2139264.1 hypothetical protein K452DRAFT_74433 [Aplosporella prunicola CBS 121167]
MPPRKSHHQSQPRRKYLARRAKERVRGYAHAGASLSRRNDPLHDDDDDDDDDNSTAPEVADNETPDAEPIPHDEGIGKAPERLDMPGLESAPPEQPAAPSRAAVLLPMQHALQTLTQRLDTLHAQIGAAPTPLAAHAYLPSIYATLQRLDIWHVASMHVFAREGYDSEVLVRQREEWRRQVLLMLGMLRQWAVAQGLLMQSGERVVFEEERKEVQEEGEWLEGFCRWVRKVCDFGEEEWERLVGTDELLDQVDKVFGDEHEDEGYENAEGVEEGEVIKVKDGIKEKEGVKEAEGVEEVVVSEEVGVGGEVGVGEEEGYDEGLEWDPQLYSEEEEVIDNKREDDEKQGVQNEVEKEKLIAAKEEEVSDFELDLEPNESEED